VFAKEDQERAEVLAECEGQDNLFNDVAEEAQASAAASVNLIALARQTVLFAAQKIGVKPRRGPSFLLLFLFLQFFLNLFFLCFVFAVVFFFILSFFAAVVFATIIFSEWLGIIHEVPQRCGHVATRIHVDMLMF
jgi:hypothetical protein